MLGAGVGCTILGRDRSIRDTEFMQNNMSGRKSVSSRLLGGVFAISLLATFSLILTFLFIINRSSYTQQPPTPTQSPTISVTKYRSAIQHAREVAARLKSPPRISFRGPESTKVWPIDQGSITIDYGICDGDTRPINPENCFGPVTFTTQLVVNGNNIDVTFLVEWADGKKSHHWDMRVTGDGQVILRREEGDLLP